MSDSSKFYDSSVKGHSEWDEDPGKVITQGKKEASVNKEWVQHQAENPDAEFDFSDTSSPGEVEEEFKSKEQVIFDAFEDLWKQHQIMVDTIPTADNDANFFQPFKVFKLMSHPGLANVIQYLEIEADMEVAVPIMAESDSEINDFLSNYWLEDPKAVQIVNSAFRFSNSSLTSLVSHLSMKSMQMRQRERFNAGWYNNISRNGAFPKSSDKKGKNLKWALETYPRHFVFPRSFYTEEARAKLEKYTIHDFNLLLPEAENNLFGLTIGRVLSGCPDSHCYGEETMSSSQYSFRTVPILVDKVAGSGKSKTKDRLSTMMRNLGYMVSTWDGSGGKFGQRQVYGQHLNFVDDSDDEKLKSLFRSATFKSMATNSTVRVEDKGIRAFQMKSISAAIIFANNLANQMLYECDSGALSRLESLYTRDSAKVKEAAADRPVLHELKDKLNGNMANNIKLIADHEGLPEELVWYWFFTLCAELYEDANTNKSHVLQASAERTIIHHYVFKQSHLCAHTVDPRRNANFLMALIYILGCQRSRGVEDITAAWSEETIDKYYDELISEVTVRRTRLSVFTNPLCDAIVPETAKYKFPFGESLLSVGNLWEQTCQEVISPLAVMLATSKPGPGFDSKIWNAVLGEFRDDWVAQGCPSEHPYLGIGHISFPELASSASVLAESRESFLSAASTNKLSYVREFCKYVHLAGNGGRLPGMNDPLRFMVVLTEACDAWSKFYMAQRERGEPVCKLLNHVARGYQSDLVVKDPSV